MQEKKVKNDDVLKATSRVGGKLPSGHVKTLNWLSSQEQLARIGSLVVFIPPAQGLQTLLSSCKILAAVSVTPGFGHQIKRQVKKLSCYLAQVRLACKPGSANWVKPLAGYLA